MQSTRMPLDYPSEVCQLLSYANALGVKNFSAALLPDPNKGRLGHLQVEVACFEPLRPGVARVVVYVRGDPTHFIYSANAKQQRFSTIDQVRSMLRHDGIPLLAVGS